MEVVVYRLSDLIVKSEQSEEDALKFDRFLSSFIPANQGDAEKDFLEKKAVIYENNPKLERI